MSRVFFLFTDCRLDIAARALWRDGVRVELSPTVFDCIAYLVGHRERAIGRDELVAAVWGKSTISDTMLGKAILAARRAIGDSAEAQALIRTVPRFGYHWVGAMREEVAADPAETGRSAAPLASHDASAHSAIALRRGRGWLIGVALAVLAILAAVALHRPAERAATAPVESSGAAAPSHAAGPAVVLPVAVVAGSEDAWLRLGLMDLMVNRLRDADVPVMSSDSVVSLLKQADATPQRIGEALFRLEPRAQLIRASIAKTGNRWTLHAELVDAAGTTRGIDASAPDAVGAARSASDRLLDLLGRHAAGTTAQTELSLDELMQRTEAARLADDLDGARALLESAPAAQQALPEVRLRRAQIDVRGGRFDAARIELERLLADTSENDDAVLRGRMLVTLCNAQGRLDQPAAAIASCSEAVALLATRDASQVLAIAYNNRAVTHLRQRDFGAAEADFARARVAFERSGDMLALLRVDGNEASMAMARNRPGDALPILVRAGDQFEQFGLVNEALISLSNQVDAQRALLQPAAALAASERGWALLGRVRDVNLLHEFKAERAQALSANGRLTEAHALLADVIGDSDADQEAATLALARSDLAALELDAGQNGVAAALALQAEPALPLPEYEQARANALLTAIRALRRAHRDADAATAEARLDEAATAAKTPITALYAALAAAERPGAGTQVTDPHHEHALALAAELGLPYLIAETAVSYGQVLIERGELERAAIVTGRVARYADTDFDSALLQTRLYRALGQREAWQAALARSRRMAGERAIPPELTRFDATTAAVSSSRQE
ncbi:MAG TPA: winged helix-turn-helix domain-containing protein [Dokdonella sp.]